MRRSVRVRTQVVEGARRLEIPAGRGKSARRQARLLWGRPSANDGRGPGVRRGLMVMRSAGREGLAEAECLQDSVEVELRQPAGEVADAELIQEVLQLGRGQVHTEAAQEALQSGEIRDSATAGEAAEELAEQALVGLRVDRDDHGVVVGLAV